MDSESEINSWKSYFYEAQEWFEGNSLFVQEKTIPSSLVKYTYFFLLFFLWEIFFTGSLLIESPFVQWQILSLNGRHGSKFYKIRKCQCSSGRELPGDFLGNGNLCKSSFLAWVTDNQSKNARFVNAPCIFKPVSGVSQQCFSYLSAISQLSLILISISAVSKQSLQ